VTNPFYGVITSGSLATATITKGQSLRPFPQFLDVSSRMASFGESSYHAMFLTLQKRTSKGFTVSASYTWSKEIDNILPSTNGFSGGSFSGSNPQNFYDPKSERSISAFDTPQSLVVSYVYEFPFGQNKPFLNQGALLTRIVGGWQINGLTTFQSGTPLSIYGGNSNGTMEGTGRPNWSGKNPTLHGSVYNRLNKFFDTSQFTYNNAFTFGTSPRLVPDLFTQGVDNWAMSLFKDTVIHDNVKLQFRAEAFNTFNRVWFGTPNRNLNSSTFGSISSQANNPRNLQLGLRMLF
jgi:hypothetical protein